MCKLYDGVISVFPSRCSQEVSPIRTREGSEPWPKVFTPDRMPVLAARAGSRRGDEAGKEVLLHKGVLRPSRRMGPHRDSWTGSLQGGQAGCLQRERSELQYQFSEAHYVRTDILS